MIIGAIIVGTLLLSSCIISAYLSSKKKSNFDTGIVIGFIMSILFMMEVAILSTIVNPLPKAMDVYQGKTTLEYTIIDGVKTDSVVIFKNDEYQGN